MKTQKKKKKKSKLKRKRETIVRNITNNLTCFLHLQLFIFHLIVFYLIIWRFSPKKNNNNNNEERDNVETKSADCQIEMG